MEPFQRESGSLVIKIYHAIHSIMASHTAFTKIPGMVNHENGILISVATHAA